MSPARPNATRADIIALLRDGHSNNRIVRELRCDKQRVIRIRAELDLPAYVPAEQTRTLEEKWATHTRPVDGGHVEWAGERASAARTPVMRYKEESYSPAAVAFHIKHGRDAEGYAIADCGMRHCVAPDHVNDEPGRLQARRELRTTDRASHCPYGHDQAEHGKFETDGRAYCGLCKILDKQEQRDPSLPRRERTRPLPTSFEDVFRTHTEDADGGHIRWTGPVTHQTPAVRFDSRLQSAYRVAFRLHHGREPEGLAMPVCDMPLCVAGGCLEDRPMRQHTRQLYAAIFGEAS
jgi:hypothetical protein